MLFERLLLCAAVATGFCSALRSEPACAPSPYQREAIGFYKTGHLEPAIDRIRQAVEACPGQGFYRFMLGNALYRANRLEEARESYRKAVELDPNRVEWHISLGFTLFELGDSREATQEWIQAMRLEPRSALARAAAAIGLYFQGDQENALIQYREAARLESVYATPEALTVDIRWKPQARNLLVELKSLANRS